MKKIFILLALATSLWSCEELFDTIDNGLTTEQVVEGLKTALELGTDSATTNLSALNGYYGNALVKIPLPPQAEQVRNLITNNALSTVFGLDNEFENVVKSINRAAEEAAKEAAPIFVDAITAMTFDDAWDILNGISPGGLKSSGFDSLAATHYFINKTTLPLTGLYAPKINTALDVDLGLGFSAVDAWSTLTSTYNELMGDFLVQQAVNWAGVTLPSSITDDLGEWSTEQALKGLYFKVGEEEKKIRRNPYDWAEDIIQKVFGSVYKP